MDTTPIPAEVAGLLAAAFPDQPISDIAPTFGGFSNLTVATTIGGRRCVVKAAASLLKCADVRREGRMLALLGASGLPIPTLIALVEDGGWTVAVTSALAGTHGLHLLESDPAELVHVYSALGQLLAAIHRTPLAPAD